MAHLWENLKYLERIKLDADIILILDSYKHKMIPDRFHCNVFYYDKSNCLYNNSHLLTHNSNFRNNFWQNSTARFFALNQWHQQNPSEKVVHIESDNLLFPNFPLKRFEELTTLAWLRHNHELDSAAILYSPNSFETTWLVRQINHQITLDPSTTDMKVLNKISRDNPSITILPSYNPIWNNNLNSDSNASLITKQFSLFDGIFDPAAIGVWLTGNDPRNSLGWIKRYMNHFDPIVNPADFFYFTENSNLVAKKKVDDSYTSIYNIHIHSKQLSLFKGFNTFTLKFFCFTSNKRKFKYFFSLRVFLALLNSYEKRQKISLKFLLKSLSIFLKSRKTKLFN